MTDQKSEQKRYQKGVKAENDTLATVLFEVVHVDFQSGQEHNVEQTGCSRQDDAAVPKYQIETMRTDDGTGDNKAQQLWNFQLIEQNRCKENDYENKQKFQYRIVDRQG